MLKGGEADIGKSWVLVEEEIKRTEKYKYLGMWVDESGCERISRVS